MGTSLARAWSDGSIVYALTWWAVLAGLGAIAWAGLRPWLTDWRDGGWAFARYAGLLVVAVPVWMAAHLVPAFTWPVVLATVPALTAAAWLLRRRLRPPPPRIKTAVIAWAELRFIAPFTFYLLMRGFNGDITGLEKPMDFAFMNVALHSPSMPPPDPWFSGHTINYYYFGHYLAAFVCQLSSTPPRFGYNLMLATVFAATFHLSWSLAAELARATGPRARTLAAAAAACWITMGGNLHPLLFGVLRPLLVAWGLAPAPTQAFLLSDPTRFVGYDPPTADKLITEFPAYAFYVGDLHAHLTNLPNVLLLLCAALGWLRAASAGTDAAARVWLAGAAALLGLFAAANAWDTAMYACLLAALFGLRLWARVPARNLLLDAGVVAMGAGLVAVWFLAGFRPPGSGVGMAHSHTPLWQWLILYGEQAGLALVCLALLHRGLTSPEGTMLIALTCCGIAFALVPEVVYLKDIYAAEFYRANTAFKFGFQAFVTLTLCACVGIGALFGQMVQAGRHPVVPVLTLELLLLPPLCYAWLAAGAALGQWRHRPWTLDGWRHLEWQAEDAAMVRWLGERRRVGDVLVEAVGESYSSAARISTNSAMPALLGWPVHELLWRNMDPEVDARRAAVAALYGAHDASEVRAIADRYGARWIVVGGTERTLYPGLNEPALRSAGEVAFEAGRSFIVRLPAGFATPAR